MGRFGFALLTAAALMSGLFTGAALAWQSAGHIPPAGQGHRITAGQWSADYSIGAANTDPKTSAIIARQGLMALPRSEAVYFTTAVDSGGQPLRETCRYEGSFEVIWAGSGGRSRCIMRRTGFLIMAEITPIILPRTEWGTAENSRYPVTVCSRTAMPTHLI